MFCFITESTALAIIRLTVYPIPIGRTPGFLSKAISRQARRGEIDFKSTYELKIILATRAKEMQSSFDAPLIDVHSLLHPCASMLDCPADPVLSIAANRITQHQSTQKRRVYLLEGDWKMQLAWAIGPVGCLLISTSMTVGESGLLGSVRLSRCRMPTSLLFERISKSALHFPVNIRSAKDRAVFFVGFREVFGIVC